MYSYGYSARAGVGKRGHGGRNYRPPPERRDPTTTPPPLKQCSCLLEFELEEYARPAAVSDIRRSPDGGRRSHRALGGAHAVQDLERFLRSTFCVHLIVPGRSQAGPVGIVGASYRETLPAAAHFLAHVAMNQNQENNYRNEDDDASSSDAPPRENKIELYGRVFVDNALDPNPTGIVGKWTFSSLSMMTDSQSLQIQPYWLFESSISWSVLACRLQASLLEGNRGEDSLNSPNNQDDEIEKAFPPTATVSTTLELLKTCLDNAVFRLGSANLSNLEFFIHGTETAFCIGHPDQCSALFQDVSDTLRKPEREP
jgi:hypothetical protein